MALVVAEGVSDSLILLAAVLLVVAGWIVTHYLSKRELEQKIAVLRRDMEERFANLQRAMEQGKVAVAASLTASLPVAASVPQAPVTAEAGATPVHQGISPELVLMISAAVTAYLGKKVRIRSVEHLQTPYEIINPWAQQGRVFVQASHNLAQRGH